MKIILLIAFGGIVYLLSYLSPEYSNIFLNETLINLEEIESVSYQAYHETWNPGDTAYAQAFTTYVESYKNPLDTTIGSSWVWFHTDGESLLGGAYDGKMGASTYHEEKGIMIDSFKARKLTFRPIAPPFYNYTRSLVRYILENQDSTTLEQKDLGDDMYYKLTIYEDRQVEFFGKAHYMPKNPYTFAPTSIYELWIDKASKLPYKYRREMSHNISIRSVSQAEFNKLNIENFVASDYYPEGYEIRYKADKRKKRQANEMIGKKAPDWLLTSSNGELIGLKDLKSKIVMLQFTGIYCGPCRISIPFLKELSAAYPKSDFDLVAIENSSKSIKALQLYQQRSDFDYTFLLSTKELNASYSVRAVPVFVILDEDRIIRKVINGYGKSTDKEIRDAIDKLL